MAVDHSEAYVRSLRFPRLPLLHGIIAGRRVLSRIRRVQRAVLPRRTPSVPLPARPALGDGLERASQTFQRQRWAFVESFLDPALHDLLVADWPARRYFAPPSDLLKSYDRGFEWRRGGRDPDFVAAFPALRALYDYIRSDECSRRVSAFAGAATPLSAYSFLATVTWPGSTVAPHRDTIAYMERPQDFLNLVLFIDGGAGPGSGALALMEDNTFERVYFRPRHLRNTALIYDVAAPGYHGFEPVRFGKARRAIICNFFPQDFRRDRARFELPMAATGAR